MRKLGWSYTPPVGVSTLRDYIRGRVIRPLKFLPKALRGSQQARDNIDCFIEWARELGLNSPDLFDVDDVVENRNPRLVLFGCVCLNPYVHMSLDSLWQKSCVGRDGSYKYTTPYTQ